MPICSSCKKIPDKGSAWPQLETSSHDHAEAEFSHGLFTVCAAKVYKKLRRFKDGA